MWGWSYSNITITCDECEAEELNTEEHDYKMATRVAKAEGWNIIKTNDGFTHLCARCTADLTPDEEYE